MLKIVRVKGQTNSSGYLELSIKIPGTFTTLNEADPTFNGRCVTKAIAWFGNYAAGGYCGQFALKDMDNILGAGAGFTLGTWIDEEADSANQGAFIPANGLTIIPPNQRAMMPSGMYIVVEFQTGNGAQDWVYANIEWNDLL